MRIGIVVIAFTQFPEVLFNSVIGNTKHEIVWIVYCHSNNPEFENRLIAFSQEHKSVLKLYRHNRGLARSWNDGILDSYHMENDLTLIVNDDVCFHAGALDMFVEHLQSKQPFALGFLKGMEPVDGNLTKMPQGFACFAFGRLAYERVGAFDENFFPAYSEDSDYHLRVNLLKLSIVWDERSLVTHERSRSLKVSSPEVVRDIKMAAELNRKYFQTKWDGKDIFSARLDRAFGVHGPFIDWNDRHQPYGKEFDRADLNPDPGECLAYVNGKLDPLLIVK